MRLQCLKRATVAISQPFSTSSRIVTCFHEVEVDDEKKNFSDRESMRQAIYDLISHQDDHGETTFRISHGNAFREYFASLLPVSSIKDDLIPQARLSFRLFLEGDTVYKSERDTFYREFGVVYSLPSHPNILRAPPSLVTTGPPQSANYGIAEKYRLICGTLYPFLERQSLQEAKWVCQISLAMAIAHSSGQYHMDLKPSNMLLNNEDDVIIIDWEQCGASPFFFAPEADGSWDVEVVVDAEPTEVWEINPGKEMMVHRKFIDPLRDDFGVWTRRNVFQLW
ncbi:kinase-like domain-containing protein [Trichoderma sp. SZMC 28012]